MKNLLLFLAFLNCYTAFSQEDAWIYFKDKPNAQFYYDNPLQMLSQRALNRRNTQNIPLDNLDIPLYQPYKNQVDAATGISVLAQSKWLNAIHVRGTQANINSLSGLSFIKSIYFANKALNTSGKTKLNPNNKSLDTQVNFNYGNSANQIEMLKGHLLHQQNYTGSGKIIAVLDAGFPNVNTIFPFQRIRDNNQILGGYNFVNRNSNFYAGNGHGTLVLSTMAGFVDNQLVGTAPDASYYLFITEDADFENPVEESFWVEAAESADSLGVDVINSSLGYFKYDNPAYDYNYSDMNGTTTFISRGADIAFSRGIIVVASAGNSGASINPNIVAPADAINVLTVGAVDASEIYASFSSKGPTFDNRVKPDVMAQGKNAVLSNINGEVVAANGTSFSSPIMAGVIACLWQAFPTYTNTQIIQMIKKSSDRFTTPTPQYGYGIPDFELALNNGLSTSEFNKNTFILHPNPVKERVTIFNPENLKINSILFYNNIGQLVLEKNSVNESESISLETLPGGIYFYKINLEVGSKTGKLIKH